MNDDGLKRDKAMELLANAKTVSRGQNMLIPPPEVVKVLVEKLAMRIHAQRWNVPVEHEEHDWSLCPPKTQEEFRGYARSALAFMRETIQSELQKTNSSLDISKNEPAPEFLFSVTEPLPEDVRRAMNRLADFYINARHVAPGRFVLNMRAEYEMKADGWGAYDPRPVGISIVEEPR